MITPRNNNVHPVAIWLLLRKERLRVVWGIHIPPLNKEPNSET